MTLLKQLVFLIQCVRYLLPAILFVGGVGMYVCVHVQVHVKMYVHITMYVHCVEAKGLCLMSSSIASPYFFPELGAGCFV